MDILDFHNIDSGIFTPFFKLFYLLNEKCDSKKTFYYITQYAYIVN